jgi:hypothetical protein
LYLDGRDSVIAGRETPVPDSKAEGNRGLQQRLGFGSGIGRKSAQQQGDCEQHAYGLHVSFSFDLWEDLQQSDLGRPDARSRVVQPLLSFLKSLEQQKSFTRELRTNLESVETQRVFDHCPASVSDNVDQALDSSSHLSLLAVTD